MVIIQETMKRVDSSNIKKGIPVTIEWKNARMIRNHSIRATVNEIVEMSKTLDVVKINAVGDPSTGKTTLAETIAHLIHKMADIPFAVKFLGEQELMNFEETLSQLSPTNYVMIFDDVSFMGGSNDRKTIEKVKQAFTKIRHLEGGQDIKIIAIFNIHYSKALDKYLRMCHFEYFTSIGNSETENAIQHLGVKYTTRIKEFQQIWIGAFGAKKKFTYQLGRKKFFVYPMRQPFAPLLFSNGMSVRHVVFPKRDWIDKICKTCIPAKDTPETKLNLEDFLRDYNKKFTKGNAKAAVKIKLFQQGINSYPKKIKLAMKYIDQYLGTKQVNLEELALAYDLNLKETKLFPSLQPDVVTQ